MFKIRLSISLLVCLMGLVISSSVTATDQPSSFSVPLDFVLTVAWSPDGQKLAVGGGVQGCDPEDETQHAIYILDASSGEVLNTLLGHICQVNTVTWSPDSKLLASGGDDSFAFVWDSTTGEKVSSAQAPKDFMARSGQTWSPDGKRLADYYAGGEKAFIWDTQNGQVLQTFEFANIKSMSAIAWNHDGNRLAVGGWNVIYIVDTDTGITQSTWHGLFGSITSLAWSADDALLVSGSADKVVRLWDLETETVLKTFVGHTKSPLFVSWSPDGNKLVSAGVDKTARIWDVATGDQLATFSSLRTISGAAWGPDGQLAYVDAGGIIQILSPDKIAKAAPTHIPTTVPNS